MDNSKPLKRPKISVYIGTSIDGYIAQEDGGLDWLERIPTPNEDFGFKEFMDSVDVLIMGRKTYDIVSGFDKWPYQGKRVIVLSKTLEMVKDEAELFSGEPQRLVSTLHTEGVKHVYVDGGMTISKFLEANMVDQITITVIPIILGTGIRLFNPMDKEHNCRLILAKSYPSGLVQLRYEVTGDSGEMK